MIKLILFLGLWAFGLSRLTSLQFIQYHVAGFYKPTIPQSPPSHLRDNSTCNNARLECSTIFASSFDSIEWCLKNGLHSEGLNPGSLSHESSALTTRPTILAILTAVFVDWFYFFKSKRKLTCTCRFRKDVEIWASLFVKKILCKWLHK